MIKSEDITEQVVLNFVKNRHTLRLCNFKMEKGDDGDVQILDS